MLNEHDEQSSSSADPPREQSPDSPQPNQRYGKLLIRRGSKDCPEAAQFVVTVEEPAEKSGEKKEVITRFEADGKGTKVYVSNDQNDRGVLTECLSDGGPIYYCGKYVEDLCKEAKDGFEKIVVGTSLWSSAEMYVQEEDVSHCSELTMITTDEPTIDLWLDRIKNGLTKVTLKPEETCASIRDVAEPVYLTDVVSLSKQWQSPLLKELIVMHSIPFTAQEFAELTMPKMELILDEKTFYERAINFYISKWLVSKLPHFQRFGLALRRKISEQEVLTAHRYVRWDDEFRETMKEFVEKWPVIENETRYTIFRVLLDENGKVDEREEVWNGTLTFCDDDQTVYFEFNEHNRTFAQKLYDTQLRRSQVGQPVFPI